MLSPDARHDLRSFGFAVDVSHRIGPTVKMCSETTALEMFEKNFCDSFP